MAPIFISTGWIGLRWLHRDLAVSRFKIPDALADQVQDLPIAGAPLVFCNIVQLVVEFRI